MYNSIALIPTVKEYEGGFGQIFGGVVNAVIHNKLPVSFVPNDDGSVGLLDFEKRETVGRLYPSEAFGNIGVLDLSYIGAEREAFLDALVKEGVMLKSLDVVPPKAERSK